MATAAREGMHMMKLSWPLALAVAAMAFAWHTASASVSPDPSDATVLVANVADGVTETYADKIASSYAKFVKIGKGTLILTAASSQTSSTDFMGSVEVREGILQLDNFYAIRACSYNSDTTKHPVSVASNAQIRITFNSNGQTANALYNVGIEGDGPDGKGAIVFNGGGNGDSIIRVLHLTGDASIGGTGRFGVGFYGKLYLNGHTLTGMNNDYMFRCVQVVSGHEGHFVKLGGSATLQNADTTVAFRGSAANTFTLSNATLSAYTAPNLDSPWTLRPLFTSRFKARNSSQWCGPIVGDGTSFEIFSDTADATCNLFGSITNVSTLFNGKSSPNLTVNLVNANHYLGTLACYRGNMVVTGGLYHAFSNGVKVNYGDTQNAAYLAFKDAGMVDVGGDSGICASFAANILARMEISGRTVYCGSPEKRIMVGDATSLGWADQFPNYWGALTIDNGAVVSNATHVGKHGQGGVIQRSSTAYLSEGTYLGYGNGSKGGVGAYGCWYATNSTLTVTGDLSIAYSPVATGFLVQKGGVTEMLGGELILGHKGGNATIYIGDGGVFRSTTAGLKRFGYNGSGGSGVFTVDGQGSFADFGVRPLNWMHNHNGFKTYVNINHGGVLRVCRFQYESLRSEFPDSRSYLSFNGGELRLIKPKPTTTDYKAFMSWDTTRSGRTVTCESYPDICTVFSDGAAINVEDDVIVHWNTDLLKPSGNSVTAIALPADANFLSANHLGALRVVIEDAGGGEGASAFVDYDDVTRKPSRIVITSPGVNYSPATTAKVMQMRGDTNWVCAVTLGEIKSGGFEKKGAGTLVLKGTNTYEGATKVSGGTLIVGDGYVFPQNQPLVMAGGKFSPGNADLAVSDLSGYGEIESGNNRITIGGKLSFSADDALAGRQLKFYRVEPVFNAGATIEVDATNLPAGDVNGRFVIATSEKPFVGEPALINAVPNWNLRFSSDRKSIIYGRERGMRIIFR